MLAEAVAAGEALAEGGMTSDPPGRSHAARRLRFLRPEAGHAVPSTLSTPAKSVDVEPIALDLLQRSKRCGEAGLARTHSMAAGHPERRQRPELDEIGCVGALSSRYLVIASIARISPAAATATTGAWRGGGSGCFGAGHRLLPGISKMAAAMLARRGTEARLARAASSN